MNYGKLKLDLIRKGVYIPKDFQKAPEIVGGIHLCEPGEEIALALAENLIAKPIIQSDPAGGMPLLVENGTVFLHHDEERFEVAVIPLPVFLKDQLTERTPLSENVCLDGYCLNIFMRVVGKDKRLSLGEEEVLSVVKFAFEEGVADLVQINMDYCEESDRGFERLAPMVKAIKKKFQTFVALKGFPPVERRTIDLMYAAGVDLLDFPLEGFAGSKEMQDLLPSHQVHTALEYAAQVFPQGTVWTELVPGSETSRSTTETMAHLVSKGIIPLLKLQPASVVTGKEFERLLESVQFLEKITEQKKLPLKWLYPNCRTVTPLDTRYYTQDSQSAKLTAKPVYRSMLSKKASEGFAAIRRKLRIKDVSDSYESAGL